MLLDGARNLSRPSYMTPDREVERVTDIGIDTLEEEGYEAMILDLDQTLTEYHGNDLAEELEDWYEDASDSLDVCILSNHASIGNQERAREVEANLDAPVIDADVKKPATAAFDEALDELGSTKERTVMVGDSPICDTAGANRYGLETVQVDPLRGDDPLLVKAGRGLGRTFQQLYGALGSKEPDRMIRDPEAIDAPRTDLESIDGVEPLDGKDYSARHTFRGVYSQHLADLKQRLEDNGIPAKYQWRPLPLQSHLKVEGDDIEIRCYTNRVETYFDDHPHDVARSGMIWSDDEERSFSMTDETIYGAVRQEYS